MVNLFLLAVDIYLFNYYLIHLHIFLICNPHLMLIFMRKKQINRLKVVLVEKNKTNKWLAEKLNKNETTISRWCTNEVQPSLDTLLRIGQLLSVDIKDLLNSTI